MSTLESTEGLAILSPVKKQSFPRNPLRIVKKNIFYQDKQLKCLMVDISHTKGYEMFVLDEGNPWQKSSPDFLRV